MEIRKITQIIKGQNTSDGAGVKLKRIIGTQELNQLDPFLLLDEFKNDNPDDYAAGFPDHPHRGFETITYMMAGAFTHRDSKGHEGHLTAGSVQWMTAGKGIIHSEMPEQTNGLAWGYQLWLNLPAKLKMTEPKYQDISSDKLPVVEIDGTRVKILSGEYEGAKSPGKSFIPFTYLDVQLKPGAAFTHPAPAGQNAFIYVIEGKAKTGPDAEPSYVKSGYLGVFSRGDQVQVQAEGKEPLRFLFASAQALNEPVVRGGPFVMNTMGDLKQAFYDYQTGNLG
ncbi:MAG TPA: pirin family protein [bacterium]|nr:pirin family protein [bacterium]